MYQKTRGDALTEQLGEVLGRPASGRVDALTEVPNACAGQRAPERLPSLGGLRGAGWEVGSGGPGDFE